MKVLVLGSSGLLGQAVTRETSARGWKTVTAARSRADLAFDIDDANALDDALRQVAPDIVFNCAGLTDLGRCERDPGLAYRVNARPLSALAHWSETTGQTLIHVSTDHYFTIGGAAAHDERAPIRLVNEYARSKYAAEAFALTASRTLVLRTSIVGIRGWQQPSFAEWAIQAVLANAQVGLFTDAYTSSIDVGTFARAALDLALANVTGLLNLAAGEVYSKAQFVQEIAAQMGRRLDHATLTSVTAQDPPRAACLGLDTSKAAALLDYPLPTLSEVVQAVLKDHGERGNG